MNKVHKSRNSALDVLDELEKYLNVGLIKFVYHFSFRLSFSCPSEGC